MKTCAFVKVLDERCSRATSGIYSVNSDASDSNESEIYTIRKVSKPVFSNQHMSVKQNDPKPIIQRDAIPVRDKETSPILPLKPARLYINH